MATWEPTPSHMIRLDVRALLQDAAITEVRDLVMHTALIYTLGGNTLRDKCSICHSYFTYCLPLENSVPLL